MGFRPKKKQPQFADLKGVLSQSKQTDNALSQTVAILIDRLSQLQGNINNELQALNPDNEGSGTASKLATYVTKSNEVGALPNSFQLLAGTGITLDSSVPNKLTVNSTGGGTPNVYDSPLSDGDLTEAHLIFADGECIIVQVPI